MEMLLSPWHRPSIQERHQDSACSCSVDPCFVPGTFSFFFSFLPPFFFPSSLPSFLPSSLLLSLPLSPSLHSIFIILFIHLFSLSTMSLPSFYSFFPSLALSIPPSFLLSPSPLPSLSPCLLGFALIIPAFLLNAPFIHYSYQEKLTGPPHQKQKVHF